MIQCDVVWQDFAKQYFCQTIFLPNNIFAKQYFSAPEFPKK
jgi:hypothetical protein